MNQILAQIERESKPLLRVLATLFIFFSFFISVGTAHAAYRNTIESDSPLYYWPMDEAAGATSVSAAIGGTAINLTGATAGVLGQTDGTAVSFNGTTNYGATASTINLSSYNKVVVEALMNYTYTGAGAVAWESTNNLNASTTGFGFFQTDPSLLTNSTVILKGDVGHSYGYVTRSSTGDWHHVAAVYDKSLSTNEVSLYIDGVLRTISSRPLNSNNTNNFGTDILYLMSRGGGSLFNQAKIQHLAIYSGLTATQIAAHAVASGVAYVVQPSDLWDNGYDNVSAPRQSTFSRLVFTTNAASIVVNGSSNIVTSYPAFAHLGIRVDGVNQSALVFSADSTQSFPVTLGSAGVTKTVEITTGVQSFNDVTVNGSFIEGITYPNTATFSIQTPTVGSRVLVYGDSISVGGNATNPEYEGYAPLLRNTYNRRVMLEGWGRRSFYDDANTSGLRAAFVNRIVGYAPATVWMAIGTNDYGLNRWDATNFGTAYATTIDNLHTALPSARIICQTPIVRNDISGTNGLGSTLADYRSQITTICNARSWTTLVDGTTILTTSDLVDGVHPSTVGHAAYASKINDVLTIPTASSVISIPTQNSAVITWSTDKNTSSKVEYGLTSTYGYSTAETDTSPRLTSHTVSIPSLVTCTTYHYRVRSKDAVPNEAVGTDNTFTTTGCTGSSTVTAQTGGSITTASGGTVSLLSSGYGLGLTIPAGATVANAEYQIKKVDSTTSIASSGKPSGFNLIGDYTYELKSLTDPNTSVTSFSQPIQITVSYQDSDVVGINESSLVIYHYSGSIWSPLTGCVVNTTLNTVTCTTTGFSFFALFGTTTTTSSSSSPSSTLERADIKSWKATLLSGSTSCLTKLKLTIKGNHFDDDTEVSIGSREASSVDVKNSRELSAKFCLEKLLKGENLKKTISLKNPDTKREEANKKIDLSLYALTSSSSSSSTLSANFDQDTKEGTMNIQKILVKLKLLEKDSITGIYGPLTRAAVKIYQGKHDITPTGNVGPLTITALKKV